VRAGLRAIKEKTLRNTPVESDEDRLGQKISEVSRWQELRDPDEGLPPIDRVINKIAEILGVAVLGSIAGIVFINACMRYLLNTSIIWAEEVVISIIPWLAMLGLFLAIRRQTMIRIEYFFEKFPSYVQRPLAVLGHILCTAVFAYVGWLGLGHVFAFGSDTLPYLGLPVGIFTVAIFVGGVVAALAFLAEILPDRKARKKAP
jgi:TRAP-type C4-dicarboxylate transport system permease small subunit